MILYLTKRKKRIRMNPIWRRKIFYRYPKKIDRLDRIWTNQINRQMKMITAYPLSILYWICYNNNNRQIITTNKYQETDDNIDIS